MCLYTDELSLFKCCRSNREVTIDRPSQFGTRLKEHQKPASFAKENSALSKHTCLTNQAIGCDKSKIITTNRFYHQRICLKACHVNSAHAPLNRAAYFLTPIYTSSEKR